MTYDEITKLLDKGLTVDQIIALSQQPTAEQQEEPAAEQQEEPAEQEKHTLSDVIASVNALTRAVQASAILSATQTEQAKQPDALDVMRNISAPFKKED